MVCGFGFEDYTPMAYLKCLLLSSIYTRTLILHTHTQLDNLERIYEVLVAFYGSFNRVLSSVFLVFFCNVLVVM